MKQKYWFTRSLTKNKPNAQYVDNSTDNNRSRNQKVIFSHESTRKQLTGINQQARKINDQLRNFRHLNRLYHDVDIGQSEVKNEVRCLKHNSVIILYCFTDNKLLCSTCVYGTSQHTKHRVNQAKSTSNRMEQVLMGNEKTIKIRSQEINSIRTFFQDIQKKIDAILQEKLQKLQVEFNQFSALLSTYYQKSKKKIIQTFESTKLEVSHFVEQMRQLSKNMRFQHPLNAVRQLYVQQVMDELNKISRLISTHKLGQNLLMTLSSYGKAVVSSFKYGIGSLSK